MCSPDVPHYCTLTHALTTAARQRRFPTSSHIAARLDKTNCREYSARKGSCSDDTYEWIGRPVRPIYFRHHSRGSWPAIELAQTRSILPTDNEPNPAPSTGSVHIVLVSRSMWFMSFYGYWIIYLAWRTIPLRPLHSLENMKLKRKLANGGLIHRGALNSIDNLVLLCPFDR